MKRISNAFKRSDFSRVTEHYPLAATANAVKTVAARTLTPPPSPLPPPPPQTTPTSPSLPWRNCTRKMILADCLRKYPHYAVTSSQQESPLIDLPRDFDAMEISHNLFDQQTKRSLEKMATTAASSQLPSKTESPATLIDLPAIQYPLPSSQDTYEPPSQCTSISLKPRNLLFHSLPTVQRLPEEGLCSSPVSLPLKPASVEGPDTGHVSPPRNPPTDGNNSKPQEDPPMILGPPLIIPDDREDDDKEDQPSPLLTVCVNNSIDVAGIIPETADVACQTDPEKALETEETTSQTEAPQEIPVVSTSIQTKIPVASTSLQTEIPVASTSLQTEPEKEEPLHLPPITEQPKKLQSLSFPVMPTLPERTHKNANPVTDPSQQDPLPVDQPEETKPDAADPSPPIAPPPATAKEPEFTEHTQEILWGNCRYKITYNCPTSVTDQTKILAFFQQLLAEIPKTEQGASQIFFEISPTETKVYIQDSARAQPREIAPLAHSKEFASRFSEFVEKADMACLSLESDSSTAPVQKPHTVQASLMTPTTPLIPERIQFYDHKTTPEYAWLGNFHRCRLALDGIEYGCAEAAFQAAKFLKSEEKAVFSEQALMATDAYKNAQRKAQEDLLGHAAFMQAQKMKSQQRSDWITGKVNVTEMKKILQAKFSQNADLKQKLLDTGTSELIEHTQRDASWGNGKNGSGQNMLGKLLMEVRQELRDAAKQSPSS